VPGQVLGRGLALQGAGRAGEEPDLVDHRRDLLRRGQPERLAGVAALQRHQLRGVLLDRVGQLQQRQLTLRRRGVAPRLERPRGLAERPVDVLGPDTGAEPNTSPVVGSTRSARRPSVASTCVPPTKLRS
jgi:hypothetical protein